MFQKKPTTESLHCINIRWIYFIFSILDLQTSSLTAFTSLMKMEIFRMCDEVGDDDAADKKLVELLDFTRFSKSVVISDCKENRKPYSSKKDDTKRLSEKYK